MRRTFKFSSTMNGNFLGNWAGRTWMTSQLVREYQDTHIASRELYIEGLVLNNTLFGLGKFRKINYELLN